MKKTFEEEWKDIEELTRWERIYLTMKALDWFWSFSDGRAIPSIEMLKHSVKDKCKRCYDGECAQISSGGFTVGYDNGLWLRFSVEEVDTNS